MKFESSELIINPNGSIYHLSLLPSDIPDHIITVGDPDKVSAVSDNFDSITKKVSTREFHTHIGKLAGKDIMVISTGIGTDNIDIVINEIDALVNIDFDSRKSLESKRKLNFYRIGTSGTVRPDINIDEFLISMYGVGMDGLAFFYKHHGRDTELESIIRNKTAVDLPEVHVYASKASQTLTEKFEKIANFRKGITLTLPGFYGPQGRSLRNPAKSTHFIDEVAQVKYKDLFVTNIEMETSGLYYLAKSLGHRAISFNAILANRSAKTFSAQPQKTVARLIDVVLNHI